MIYEHFLKLREVLRDIQRFAEVYSIDFRHEPDTDALLRTIQSQIGKMATSDGLALSITPWRLLEFVRNSWYHWMRVTPYVPLHIHHIYI